MNKNNPYILSTETKFQEQYQEEKIYLQDLNTFTYAFSELGEWLSLTVEDIEPYIELRVV